ncbi:conserved hypothetical protein [Candidatus Terasakiella magnetica]|uniref:Uncharacterized protein n=1 Tax=Candidatus Terasakiella magnetica TaxID=1867952 RepID=A0A1C3RDL2_9PROT|nr:hypothetical protein [Candidatus Terasakiella magnetica]SCA55383.1 conserved hypothetical protein [Candidatus Terasakiella magnetica]
MSRALIVYSDNTGVWWLRFLRAGFRHCFIILETDRGTIWVDPLSNNLTLKILEGYELAGLIRWYRDMGMHVQSVCLDDNKVKSFPWAPMTCVEVVKRLVGIRNPFIITPYQLYLSIKGTKSENIGKNILTLG